jgi:hypothetical protein
MHNCLLTFYARSFNPVLCFKYVITRHILPSPLSSQGNVVLKHIPHFILLQRMFKLVLLQTCKICSCLCTLRSSTDSLTRYIFTLNMALNEILTLSLVSYLKTQHEKSPSPPPTSNRSNLPHNAMLNRCYIDMQCVHLVGVYVISSPFTFCRVRPRRCSVDVHWFALGAYQGSCKNGHRQQNWDWERRGISSSSYFHYATRLTNRQMNDITQYICYFYLGFI